MKREMYCWPKQVGSRVRMPQEGKQAWGLHHKPAHPKSTMQRACCNTVTVDLMMIGLLYRTHPHKCWLDKTMQCRCTAGTDGVAKHCYTTKHCCIADCFGT
jgi:hypothetical protein